jgi:hypothetical protein
MFQIGMEHLIKSQRWEMQIQPITLSLNQIAFGHFLSQSFHKDLTAKNRIFINTKKKTQWRIS